MKVIGITGGVGSGKSRVAKILKEDYKAVLLNTDQIAQEQMEVGGASYQDVVDYFGTSILDNDGSIHRGKLAELVFQDEGKLRILNGLTHPKVMETVKLEIEVLGRKQEVPYVVMETALMIELMEAKLDHTICDEVWYVYTPAEERRKRLKETRNYSDEKIDHIFLKQRKEEEYFEYFPKVVKNTGDFTFLKEQVKNLLLKIE